MNDKNCKGTMTCSIASVKDRQRTVQRYLLSPSRAGVLPQEVENEETVTELEKAGPGRTSLMDKTCTQGTELLQAKPKMMARPSRQPARDTSRVRSRSLGKRGAWRFVQREEPPLAWKEPFNSPQASRTNAGDSQSNPVPRFGPKNSCTRYLGRTGRQKVS